MLEDHTNLTFILPGLAPDADAPARDLDDLLASVLRDSWYPGELADVVAELDRALAAGPEEADDLVLTYRDVALDGSTPVQTLQRLRALAAAEAAAGASESPPPAPSDG